MEKRTIVIVDGSNVAYEEKTDDGKPRVANLQRMFAKLEEEGLTPILIVDAALRHEIDDPDELEALFEDQRVRQAPAGTDADFFIIKLAEEHEAQIVSNDRFKPFHEEHPWLKDSRIPYMIVEGDVQLYEPALDD